MKKVIWLQFIGVNYQLVRSGIVNGIGQNIQNGMAMDNLSVNAVYLGFSYPDQPPTGLVAAVGVSPTPSAVANPYGG